MRKAFVSSILILFAIVAAHAQVFEEIRTDLRGVMQPVSTWIDAAHNGKLDAVVNGDYYVGNNHHIISQLSKYKESERYITMKSIFPALYRGAVAVADYDGDGDDDIIMTGINTNNQLMIKLFRSNGPFNYTTINEMMTPVTDGSIEWGDYDNDEDLDLLITGREFNNKLSTRIYRNDGGFFSETEVGLPGVYNGVARWGDFDNDKDLDILITGDVGEKPFTAVYKNNNGSYEKLIQTFIPLRRSDAAWGDLDTDGDLDFIISGEDAEGYPICVAYNNESKTFFRQIALNVRPLKGCTIDLGDFDADDDLDLLMTGESLERPYTLVYRNNLSYDFEDMVAGLPGVNSGDALWGDYDQDGDLDILLTGLTICYEFIGTIYRNTIDPPQQTDDEDIFINAPMPQTDYGPFYYYVWSSCYCDPSGGDNIGYHLYISNIHLQNRRYELNYKFNDLLLKAVPNWGDTDRGFRTNNGHETKAQAAVSREELIESYKHTGFKVHYLNW